MCWESLKTKTILTTFPIRRENPQKPSKKRLCAVSCFYLCLTLMLTSPLIAKISTHICGDRGDNYAFAYLFWWFDKALTDLHTNPFYTHYMHYPHGTSLLLIDSLFNILLSIPLQKVLPLITSYNLLVLFSFWIAAVGMYLLVFHLTGSSVSSFIAGFIYAFCSFHFAHALGHLSTLSIEWIPFFVLYLIKSLHEGRSKHILVASLFLTLNALCTFYYLVYCSMLLGWMVLYCAIPWDKKKSIQVVKKGALVLGLSLLSLAPIILPMIVEKIHGNYPSGHPPSQYPADLASFFIPNVTSTYSMLFYPIWSGFKANAIESSTFVGYSVLFLLVYSTVKAPAHVRAFWISAAGVFFFLSLGPYLNLFGKSLPIPLPYLAVHHVVPFASFTGVPARLHIMTTACSAVLIGYGISTFIRNMKQSTLTGRKKILYRVGITGVAVCLVLDHLHVPMVMTKHSISPFYVSMGSDPREYAIIDLTAHGKALFCQTLHHKKLVGGYLPRVSQHNDSFLRNTDIIRHIFFASSPTPGDGGYPDSAHAKEALGRYQVNYIIYPREYDLLSFKTALYSCLGLPLDVTLHPEPTSESPVDNQKTIREQAGALIEEVVKRSGWEQTLQLLFKVRFLFASRPEIFPYDANIPSTAVSEYVVGKVWKFPLVYEDEEIRVYSTES